QQHAKDDPMKKVASIFKQKLNIGSTAQMAVLNVGNMCQHVKTHTASTICVLHEPGKNDPAHAGIFYKDNPWHSRLFYVGRFRNFSLVKFSILSSDQNFLEPTGSKRISTTFFSKSAGMGCSPSNGY
ncbi:MAG: hypothetical protein QG618_2287, partial [Thermodesulfobacteriota bacterium]|nr:hypothetical protein [Thermodesulfobacteriota bacterium]